MMSYSKTNPMSKLDVKLFISLLITPFILKSQCMIDNTCGGDFANVVIGEVSGDSSQSDGCEDAIVEIIGPPGTNIGCMVVTDTEWAVLLPPGSVIPTNGVFFIGCSASMDNNCGVGNPSMSGLIGGTVTGCEGGGNEGDFNASLLAEFDFDTCDPANAGFYDPAATGFTLDNPGTQSSNGDGEQVFLFLPDGTVWDGIFWDGGGTGAADHASVSLYGVPYTLGDNDGNGIVNDVAGTVIGGRGDGGNATAVPILPTDAGCPCNTPGNPGTFTVPPIIDDVWFEYTNGDHVGCNSSFIRGPLSGMGFGGSPSHTDGLITSTGTDASGQPTDNGGGLASGTTGDAFTPRAYTPSSCGDPSAEWGYTDNPTPGQPNNDPAFVFYADVTQVCSTTDPVTFTVEIYNHQQVSDGSIDFALGGSSGCANGETGSLVDVNGTQQVYDNYTIAGEQTTMTVTISNWNVGTNMVGLVWDNWSNTNGTSGNPATQSNPNECYEEFVFLIEVAEPLLVLDAEIDCDAGDAVAGTVNVTNFITGGANNTYGLYSDNPPVTLVSSNTSGVFTIPEDGDAMTTYTVIVTDGSGCSMPVELTIVDNCELPPVCPTNLNNTGTTPDSAVCPGDMIELCLDGDDLPPGGTICWYETTDGTDPISEDAATATVMMSATATQIGCVDVPEGAGPPMGGPVLNEILYDPINNDGSSGCTGEAIEIAGTPGTDLSCYMLGDGDWVVVLPVGTVIPPDGYLVIGEEGCADIPSGIVDVDLGTCGCATSDIVLTNSGEHVGLYDPTGTLIDGIIFEENSNGDNNGPNGQVDTPMNPPGCTNGDLTVPVVPDYDIPPAPWSFIGTNVGNGSSIELNMDVTGVWQEDNDDGNTMGGPNGETIVVIECFSYTAPNLCAESPATITVEPLISPIDPFCTDAEFMYVGATSTFTIDCPLAEIMASSIDVCLADQASVDFPVTITGGTGPYTLTYDDGSGPTTINGLSDGGNINIPGPTNGKITIILVSVIDEGGAMCNGAVNDSEFCVNIRPEETLTIISSAQPSMCDPCDGTISFDIDAGGTSANSFDIDFTINGVMFSIASVSMPYTLTGACPGIYEITGALDDNGCPMLVTPNEQELIAPSGIPIEVTVQPADICATDGSSVDLSIDAIYNPAYTAADFTFYDTNPTTLPPGALTNSPPLLTSPIVSPTSTTTYWVLYIDPDTGCESVTSVTVTVIEDVPMCDATNDGTCLGDAVMLNETGGDAMSWSWTGPTGANFDNTTIASPTITPGVAGTYTVTVTNADGCIAECSTEVTLDGPSCTVGGTDTICGDDNGTATANSVGGLTPYSYVWSNGATGMTIMDLASGTYSVTVTDAAACTSECMINIEASVSPECTVAGINTSCGEDNGFATVSATDGIEPYTFSWSNGATGLTIMDLASGDYIVTVTDAAGCTIECMTSITASTSPACTVVGIDTTCGDDNGSATVSASDGIAPYTFSWSNGDTGTSVSDLLAGIYEVTVTDAEGCESTCDVTISMSESPTCSIDNFDNESCLGGDGSATVSPIGGTPPYTFSWSNGATANMINDLTAGTYMVTVTDESGCTTSCSITLVADIECEFDLALDKVLNTTKTPGPFSAGGTVVYTICVYNQGVIDATNTQVTDYGSVTAGNLMNPVLPATGCPYPLISSLGAAVVITTTGTATYQIDNLGAGDSVCINIEYTIGVSPTSPIINNAEITIDSGDDDDSAPDDNSGSDPELDTDNETNDDPDDPNDEDDFDPEIITLQMCPMLMGQIDIPIVGCEGQAFDIQIDELIKFAFILNDIQDFGLDFVYFENGPPLDPYIGGTSIGSLTFGELEGDPMTTQSATLSNEKLASGTYTICAILSPSDMLPLGCNPSSCTDIEIHPTPSVAPVEPSALCAGGTLVIDAVPIGGTGNYVHNWMITDDGGATGVSLTDNGDGTVTIDGTGIGVNALGSFTITIEYSVTDEAGCVSDSGIVQFILSQTSCGVFAWDGK